MNSFNVPLTYCILPLVQNTDCFEPGGSDRLVKLLRHHFDNKSEAADQILCAGFKLAKTIAKSENNKGLYLY